MNKGQLLETIQKEREAFEACFADLTPEQMTPPGVMGEWSVKDILGHIATWEAWLVTLLYSIERGVTPKLPRSSDVDKINAQSVAEQRDRPLERVLADFQAVHAQLLKRLGAVKERDLTDPMRFSWAKGKPLEEFVANNTYEHYAEHRPAIEVWRSKSSGSAQGQKG
jgi:uncharacterized protein (TIGR03083 family)